MTIGVGILGVLAVLVFYLIATYNGLVKLKAQIEEAWAQIDVQLKRRADLIPNLVNTVKGYAKHEKDVFTQVTEARSALMKAGTPGAKAEADNMLTGALKSLFAVAEAYPELKANENFTQLQKELSDTEDKVAYARQFYNTQVMEFNTKIRVFPNVLIANMLGFKEQEYFETKGDDREAVKVDFSEEKKGKK